METPDVIEFKPVDALPEVFRIRPMGMTLQQAEHMVDVMMKFAKFGINCTAAATRPITKPLNDFVSIASLIEQYEKPIIYTLMQPAQSPEDLTIATGN